MSTLKGDPCARSKTASGAELAVVALGTLIALGVAVLFLALTGASRTSFVPRHQSPSYVPLIQYHGTEAPPTATRVPRTPAH